MLEVGYVGTRGTHLLRSRSLNQALPATTANSIRGVTSNTVANIGLRVPVQGVPPDALDMVESAGSLFLQRSGSQPEQTAKQRLATAGFVHFLENIR